MRREYNAGNWQRARELANLLLSSKEPLLPQSVITRSYYNQSNYNAVIESFNKWPRIDLHNYYQSSCKNLKIDAQAFPEIGISATKYEVIPDIGAEKWDKILKQQPIPLDNRDWDGHNILNNWLQEEERVWLRYPEGWIYWDMPSGFSLKNTHNDLLILVSEILLIPWYKESKIPFTGSRKMGELPALSFSAGVDSTAAMIVMPENTILGYHRRCFKSQLDHRNAELLINHLESEQKRKVYTVDSNHELLRVNHGKMVGFSTDFAPATHLILLADYLDIGGIAFGTPIDNTWLWKGRKYRKFEESTYLEYWANRFKGVGIELFLPIAGISEGGAVEICKKSKFIQYLNSCMRGDGSKGCGRCWKCFHKNGPLGRPFDIMAPEIHKFLHTSPLRTTTHVLWAIKEMRIEEDVPHLKNLLDQDLSWWTSVYPPAKNILPQKWREETWSKILEYISEMDKPYLLESVNQYDE